MNSELKYFSSNLDLIIEIIQPSGHIKVVYKLKTLVLKGVTNAYFQQMLGIKTSIDELKTSQNSVLQRIEQFCTSQEKVQECKW